MSMARICKGTTIDGQPCQRPASGGSDYCPTHDPAKKRCGARNRRGEPCQQFALHGHDRCKNHIGGGKRNRGENGPAYVHGKKSALLPKRFLELADRAANDPDLMSLHDEVAILDIRIAQLARNVDEGPTNRYWLELRRLRQQYATAVTEDEQQSALVKMLAMIDAGASEADRWEEMSAMISHKAAAIKSEAQRLKTLDGFMPIDQVVLLIRAMVFDITDVIDDPDKLATLKTRFASILNKGGGGALARIAQ